MATKKSVQERFDEIVSEHKDIYAQQIRKSMNKKQKRNPTSMNQIKEYFAELHRDVFDDGNFVSENNKKTKTYIRRILDWHNQDVELIKEIMYFAFMNWSRLKKELHINAPRPTWSILATTYYWNRIRHFKDDGFERLRKDRESDFDGAGVLEWD